MRFVAIDVETANPNMSSICQIGLVLFDGGAEVRAESVLVNPRSWFDPMNVSIHGIEAHHVRDALSLAGHHSWLRQWTAGETVVCHTHFDRVALSRACEEFRLPALSCGWLDSAKVTRRTWTQFSEAGYGLANVARHCGIEFRHHDALEDARTCGLIMLKAMEETGLDLAGWIDRCRRPVTATPSVLRKGDGDGGLAGETIVFTGALQMPRQQAADLAAVAGGDVTAGVTKHTTMLVVGDQDISKLNGRDKSNKHLKAENQIAKGQAIRIVGETDFLALSAITT